MCMRVCMHESTCVRACKSVHVCVRACMSVGVCACVRACECAYTHVFEEPMYDRVQG